VLYVFGTLLEITAYTGETEAFQRAVAQLDSEFQRMHRDWHAWRGEGELIRLNRALARGETLTVSPELAELLLRGRSYSQQSDGLFNPALGRLIALWGFHQDELPVGKPPEAKRIRQLVEANPRMSDLQIRQTRIGAGNRAVQLDLGAYAKGYALNQAVDQLKRAGITQVVVNAGGDLCAAGRHGERPWRIGIRHPQGNGVLASLEVAGDECVLTSGNYERYLQHEGIRYSHIIDPRTGYPVEHIASATVIHRDGALADAAATALSVAGPKEWARIARRMGVDQVLLVDEQGRVMLTPAMQQRIRFENSVESLNLIDP
jgi:thiamine biosynthesis lipoprotein